MRINKPGQQSVSLISSCLNLNVYYGCSSFRIGNDLFIRRSTKEQEWQLFGHELGHYLRHCGNQFAMYYLFRDLQENQAKQFAYHFCVPTFMLDNLQSLTANDIADTFTVEYEFALNRLEMYERKVIDAGIYY